MKEKCKEVDMETHFKDAFRAFSKDKEGFYSFTVFIDPIEKKYSSGCIPADELKFVMDNLPGHVNTNPQLLWKMFECFLFYSRYPLERLMR